VGEEDDRQIDPAQRRNREGGREEGRKRRRRRGHVLHYEDRRNLNGDPQLAAERRAGSNNAEGQPPRRNGDPLPRRISYRIRDVHVGRTLESRTGNRHAAATNWLGGEPLAKGFGRKRISRAVDAG
jgi:hypothetical protein